ncbi:MAG: cadmium-translocating P-type ATPase, partial [Lancefieldella rimae]|nr:cadmium-translocating P-type ATPase [Lancefieldella rimae]
MLVIAHLVSSSVQPLWQQLLMYLPAYLVVGYDVVLEALESIREGEVFSEDLLMSIATIGALIIGFVPNGSPMFPEAVFVMLFFQVGELFEDMAEDKSRRSIAKMMDIRPDTATVIRSGKECTVHPSDLELDEHIIIRPGDRVPVDAEIIEGSTSLDTVALTGESVPRSVGVGDAVISGCVNLSGVIRARVTHLFSESTATRIVNLVESANGNKSRSESFIKRFAHVYTPIVVFGALALAIFPPLLTGNFYENFATWLVRSLTFLIVSCPCALVVSVPLTFFGGIGAASKQGILVKGSNYIDALSTLRTVVFDKTGTLTEGVFEVMAVHPKSIDEKSLLHLAAHVERHSTHPIAAALRAAYPNEDDTCRVSEATEVAGKGVIAQVNGKTVAVGSALFMKEVGVTTHTCQHHDVGTVIHVAVDGEYMGHIVISDREKADAQASVSAIKQAGVSRVVMLTGDREEVAADMASRLGIDEYRSELLPQDKVSAVEQFLSENPAGATLAFVGDGINDAPVLARADVGIAMGVLGSDAAIEAADVVLMDDSLGKVATAIRLARKTLAIARQNIVFAIGVKVAILALAACGYAPMWLAVFGDTGVLILAVLNASR